MSEAVERVDWHALLEQAITSPGRLSEAYSRFYNYSFGNMVYLLMQGTPIEPIATYKRWAAIGRQVRRGERAKEIIRPIVVKRTDDEGNESAFTRFKSVKCVFPLSATDGEPVTLPDLPGWELDRALKRLDITQVPFEMFDGNVQGYSRGREFALNPVGDHPRMTLLHELGHIVLGHTAEGSEDEYKSHRGVKEFQAESTAYLVGHELGFISEDEAAESRGYVQGWLKGQRPSDQTIKQVLSATDLILRAGRPQAVPAEVD